MKLETIATILLMACTITAHAAGWPAINAVPARPMVNATDHARRATADDADGGSLSVEGRAPSSVSATFFACVRKADTQPIAVAACISDEREYQDARLNRTYKTLLVALDAKSKGLLVAAEREWLSLKVKDEDLEGLLYGDDQVDNLQQGENEVFRICERANVLDRYLKVVNAKPR